MVLDDEPGQTHSVTRRAETRASPTIHHWTDVKAGIAEMRRVARHRLVILPCDSA